MNGTSRTGGIATKTSEIAAHFKQNLKRYLSSSKNIWGRTVKFMQPQAAVFRHALTFQTLKDVLSFAKAELHRSKVVVSETLMSAKALFGKNKLKERHAQKLLSVESCMTWLKGSNRALTPDEVAVQRKAKQEKVTGSLLNKMKKDPLTREAIRKYNLSSEEALSVHACLTSRNIANEVSDVDKLPAEQKAKISPMIKAAEAGLSKLPEYNGVTYTAVNTEQISEKLRVGDIPKLKGFNSATTKKINLSAGQTVLVIHSKKGRVVKELSNYRGLNEVMFKPGSRFQVAAIKKSEGSIIQVDLVDLAEE